MQHLLAVLSLIMLLPVATATPGHQVQEPSPDPTFLDGIRIVEAKPDDGELTFRDLEGKLRTLSEGDYVEEVDGARVKSISRTTLTLVRIVRGGDGEEGEALIVVRFDASGKTKVREYRTVPDVSSKPPRQPDL